MKTTGKATIIAALITAVAVIAGALITEYVNPPEVPPTVVTPEEPPITCPEVPPTELRNVTPEGGMVWIQEEWNWEDGEFELTPGHWERERADYGNYKKGHWETSNGNCVWIRGAFEGQTQNSTIITTDHRTPSAP